MNNMRLLTSIGGIDDDLIVRAGTDIMASQIKKDKKKTKHRCTRGTNKIK